MRVNSLFWRKKEYFSVKRPGPKVLPNVGLRLNSTKGQTERIAKGKGEKTHREIDIIKVAPKHTVFFFTSLLFLVYSLLCAINTCICSPYCSSLFIAMCGAVTV